MNTGLEDSVFFKLVRVVNLTARPFQQRVGRQHQLTLNEWRAMAVLGARPGLTATQVADLTGLDKMAVSRALAGLQRHKRLHRHEDPTDLRRSRLYLSSIGKALYATASSQAREREAELFAGVDTEELRRMNATLDKLIASVAGTVESGSPA
ncbi:MarR family winged helix-turn-helix transcriptional regulator [Variovorax sp. J22P240]|uniref:MarR family winged helix-turn-helix transcriptional regulator n=1 Tax=Variovorax sp. J22P240 TaxID=3053514 RepID=UPI002577F31C|nr:MarR family winged helix-turn-helix transcriptional regulator [Variovorax sp. J22P240]MDM0000063.1 MarR family winged helix-turn-helix transcriptional regulator [Variovorax sp. J22P240]